MTSLVLNPGKITLDELGLIHAGVCQLSLPESARVNIRAAHALVKAAEAKGKDLNGLTDAELALDLTDLHSYEAGRTGTLVAAGGTDWNVPVQIRLYRQRAEMSPVAESLWELALAQVASQP